MTRIISKLYPPTGEMYVEHSTSTPVESLLVVDLAAVLHPECIVMMGGLAAVAV